MMLKLEKWTTPSQGNEPHCHHSLEIVNVDMFSIKISGGGGGKKKRIANVAVKKIFEFKGISLPLWTEIFSLSWI